ncbi:hypothetical protein TNCV_624781 [Trichonephila clavipes]|nr:hypothetical protein TNCV_624781 [Trichonephila clavipes]
MPTKFEVRRSNSFVDVVMRVGFSLNLKLATAFASNKVTFTKLSLLRGVKASLTRLENTFDEINTRNEISIRLSRLDDLFKEFERLDSNLSLEESELQEFEDRYFYLNAKFNDKLDELNVQNQGRTQKFSSEFNYLELKCW